VPSRQSSVVAVLTLPTITPPANSSGDTRPRPPHSSPTPGHSQHHIHILTPIPSPQSRIASAALCTPSSSPRPLRPDAARRAALLASAPPVATLIPSAPASFASALQSFCSLPRDGPQPSPRPPASTPSSHSPTSPRSRSILKADSAPPLADSAPAWPLSALRSFLHILLCRPRAPGPLTSPRTAPSTAVAAAPSAGTLNRTFRPQLLFPLTRLRTASPHPTTSPSSQPPIASLRSVEDILPATLFNLAYTKSHISIPFPRTFCRPCAASAPSWYQPRPAISRRQGQGGDHGVWRMQRRLRQSPCP
jgi:hypothetical protein